jgi:hypothetical protein
MSNQMAETTSPIASFAPDDADSAASNDDPAALLASSAILLIAPDARAEILPDRDPLAAVRRGTRGGQARAIGVLRARGSAAVEALVDRLIPPDPETPGAKDCGCAVFIDRQLAALMGQCSWPTPQQGLYLRRRQEHPRIDTPKVRRK